MPKRILTIDDASDLRYLVASSLEGAGFEVAVARSGDEALARLDAEPFDLVITDVNMPAMSGYDLTRAIRSRPTRGDTPVVVLSSEGTDKAELHGTQAGVTRWIAKPCRPAQVIDTVRQILR